MLAGITVALALAAPIAPASPLPGLAGARTYVLPVRGVIGLDFDGELVAALAKDIAESKPDLVVIEVDSSWSPPDGDLVALPPNAELSAITDLRDAIEQARAAIGAVPAAVFVRNAVGLEAFAALAWPTVYMAPGARLGADKPAADGAKDADIAAKMASAWVGIGSGIANLGGHGKAELDAVFASGPSGGLDAKAAIDAKVCDGTAPDAAAMVEALGKGPAAFVGRGKAIADGAAGWRKEVSGAMAELKAFSEPMESSADLLARRKSLVAVQSAMRASPRVARALWIARGLTEERVVELLAELDAASAHFDAAPETKPRWVEAGAGRFLLVPLSGGIGYEVTAESITAAGRIADESKSASIVVLEFDSPGGIVAEAFKISKAIDELRRRHRVVTWIKEAMGAATMVAMRADDIYFRPGAAMGATMQIRGAARNDEISDAAVRMALEFAPAARGDEGRMIMAAIVDARSILTYTKDASGKVTFRDKVTGAAGEVVLSDDRDSLCFNSSNALECGVSRGTAASAEELGKLLGIPAKSP